MKASEFKKLIREEVKKSLNEATQLPKGISPDQVAKIVTPILEKLEKDIEAAAQNVTTALTKRRAAKTANIPGQVEVYNMMITRKGVEEVKALVEKYNEIGRFANLYADRMADPSASMRKDAPRVLAILNAKLQQYGL